MSRFTPIAIMVAAGWTFAAGPSQAALEWTFQSGNCVIGSCTEDGRTFEEAGGDPANTVDVSAWAAAGGANENQLESARLMQYSVGLGVLHPADGQGEADNVGTFDAVLFDFGAQQINLAEISIGWFDRDSDITVLAYTGAADPFSTTTNLTDLVYGDVDDPQLPVIETFTTNGWSLIGNHDVDPYAATQSGAENAVYTQELDGTDNDDNVVYSSYWLIGAYNHQFGDCNVGDVCEMGNDELTILALAGELDPGVAAGPTGVAEPSSLLLLAFGIMVPAAFCRRREKRAAA